MTSARDQRPYNVAYYARNRNAEIERVTRRQRATLGWLRDLRRVPCMDCGGIFPPHVMDFDHRDPKTKSFSLGAGKSLLKNRTVLESEIVKCDIVCANCHRQRTHAAFMRGEMRPESFRRKADRDLVGDARDREKWRRIRTAQADLLRVLREQPCMDCGKTYPWFVMEFDHRDPSNKSDRVPFMAGRASLKRLLEEVAKCDIVCATCHRDRTFHRRECRDGSCARVWCSGYARDPSKIEGRVRFPLPAPDTLRSIEESATPYRSTA